MKLGLLGNIVIKGEIEAITGLHIGTAPETIEIGGIDSPVIKHPITDLPYIPGSSLKGKMRSFQERIEIIERPQIFKFNRESGSKGEIKQHVCDDVCKSYLDEENNNEDQTTGAINCPVCRVYGSTGKNNGNNLPSRIVVRDANLANPERMKLDGVMVYEAKMENTIDRMTAAANPRTLERVPSGAKFTFEIIYKVLKDVENCIDTPPTEEGSNIPQECITDIRNIFLVLSLIEKDGLGGNISRGYGQVKFHINQNESQYYPIITNPENFNKSECLKVLEDLKSEFGK